MTRFDLDTIESNARELDEALKTVAERNGVPYAQSLAANVCAAALEMALAIRVARLAINALDDVPAELEPLVSPTQP